VILVQASSPLLDPGARVRRAPCPLRLRTRFPCGRHWSSRAVAGAFSHRRAYRTAGEDCVQATLLGMGSWRRDSWSGLQVRLRGRATSCCEGVFPRTFGQDH